jgi:hypothetical protein
MKKVLLASFLGLAGLGAVHAQQRLVLVEHFTQASCGPCASQNPALKAVLDANQGKVVALKYQTSWPGVDPMNAANPTEVASRVGYYNVSGVPNSVMDGNFYNGAPSGVNSTRINQRYNAPASVNLDVKYFIIDNAAPVNDSMIVTAKVKAVQALTAGHVLHLACIERQIDFATPPGSNGEKHFESVMKKMLPDANGTALPAMAVGDSMEVAYKWSLVRANGSDAYYNLGQAAAVGFVQNVSTKAVLQAGYDEPRPWLAVSMPQGAKSVRIKADDQLDFSVSAVSKSDQDQFVKIVPTITGLPAGWTVSILADGNTYTGEAIVPLLANSTKDVVVRISGDNADNGNKKLSVKIDVNSETILPGVKQNLVFTAITPSNILYMDLAGTANSRFSAAFSAATQPYVYLNAEETPNLDKTGLTFSNVKKIYYSTGASYAGTITTSSAEAFTDYLNSGGNMFVMGQDIGYELANGGSAEANDFYNQYMASDYVADGVTTAVGVVVDENDELLAPYFPNGFTIAANAASYPDQISISGNAIGTTGSFLNYSGNGDDGPAAVYNFNDTWKVVYVPFRMEGIPLSGTGPAFRNNLISTTNKWFDGVLTSNQMVQELEKISPAYPNPAKNTLNIPVGVGKSKVSLTSVSGQLVKSMEMDGTQKSVVKMSIADVPAGMYFLNTSQAGSPAQIQKIVIQ